MSSAARARQSEQAVRHRWPCNSRPRRARLVKDSASHARKASAPALSRARGRSAVPLVGSFAELQMEQYRRSALRAVGYLGPRTAAREHRDVLRWSAP
jgi:hypothetical protein